MSLSDRRFLIVGCTTPEPASMPLDPEGALRMQSEEVGVERLRRALDRNVSDHDSFIRVQVRNEKGDIEDAARSVTNTNRWICGSEAAETVLNTIGVRETLAMIQAAPGEAREMAHYLADRLAPPAPDVPAPQLAVDQRLDRDRRPTPRMQLQMDPRRG